MLGKRFDGPEPFAQTLCEHPGGPVASSKAPEKKKVRQRGLGCVRGTKVKTTTPSERATAMKSIQIFAALAAVVTLPFAVACGGAPSETSTGSGSSASSAESCETESDCTGFLPRSVEVCSDGSSEGAHWECKKHSCEIAYCSSEKTSDTGSCESASDCSGLLPQSVEVCSNGSSEAAHWECTSHACVIGYCSSSKGSSTGSGSGASNTCHSASDCTGFLPQSLESCNDGTSQPAQWDCNAGACAISYCDSDGGTAS